jgi:cell division GTPase FtsZ
MCWGGRLPRSTSATLLSHDEIAAAIKAITGLVTGERLISFDFADLRMALKDGGLGVFGEGEAAGPAGQDRAIRAVEAAFADLKRKLRAAGE